MPPTRRKAKLSKADGFADTAQISLSALRRWGRLVRHGSHRLKALGHRFFGQAQGRARADNAAIPLGWQLAALALTKGDKVVNAISREQAGGVQ